LPCRAPGKPLEGPLGAVLEGCPGGLPWGLIIAYRKKFENKGLNIFLFQQEWLYLPITN
jgi:hypothetical protein